MTEIAENTWLLRMQADPFVASSVTVRMPVGMSIADAVEELDAQAEEIEFFTGGENVARKEWWRVHPGAGDVIEARGVPGGPLAFVVPALATQAFAIGGLVVTWGQIVGVALSFGLQLLASALFKPKVPGSPNNEKREVYSISGARNDLRPWEAVPIVLGTHRMTPPFAGNPYTQLIGETQYLRLLVAWGYGPISISDLRIGTTPVTAYSDIFYTTSESNTLELYPSRVDQENVGAKLTTSWQTRTTAIDTNEAVFTINWPSGMYRINDEGKRRASNARVMAEYAPTGTTTWVRFHDLNYEEKTYSPFYRGFRVQFPSKGTWDVRMSRDEDQTDSDTQEEVYWLNMKSVEYGAPCTVANVAKTAMLIRATDQLNGVVDQINAIVSRKIPVWNGSTWGGTVATSNPAAIFRDVLTGIGNARALDTTRVDGETLGAWYQYCATNGLTYNRVLETQVPVKDLLEEIAAAGHASPILRNGKWSVTIDTYRSTVVQHFTPRNTFEFSGAIALPDQPHALRVQFSNAGKGYEADEIIVYDDGYTSANATKFEAIRPSGVTTSANAYKVGRHFLASGRLRPEQFSFGVDFENLVAERGDLVRITHDVPLIGQVSGRIKAIDGNDITVDEFCTFETDTTYNVRVRRTTGGTDLQAATAAGVGSYTEISVTDASGFSVGDMFMFGETNEESILGLVHSIEHAGDLAARVTCIPYNEAVYTSAATIPAYESVVSSPVSLSVRGPATPVIQDVVSDEGALQLDMAGIPVPTILVRIWPGDTEVNNTRITQTTGYRVGWRPSGETTYEYMTVSADSDVVKIYGVEAREPYDLIVFALDMFGNVSAAATVAGHIVTGLDDRPPAVDTFRVANRGGSAYVEWTYPSIVGDVAGYEIRRHADQGVTDWSRMLRIATEVPRDARSFMVPSSTGSYAIKPFDALGYRSETALFVSSNLSDPSLTNVVLSFTETSSFAGTMDGVAEVSGRLQLDSQLMIADITDLSTVTDIAGDVVSSGTYTFWSAQDLGAVYTVNIWWEAEVDADNRRNYVIDWEDLAGISDLSGGVGFGDEYDVEMQISYSRDDVGTGMTWSDYARFTAGEYTGRHFRFRMVLTTVDPLISPSVDDFTVVIDAPDRVERGEDVTSGTSTYSVTFSAAFMEAPNVSIAAQDLATGDYFAISNKAATGFDIDFYNSSATAVSRTFDWQAIGIGREAA